MRLITAIALALSLGQIQVYQNNSRVGVAAHTVNCKSPVSCTVENKAVRIGNLNETASCFELVGSGVANSNGPADGGASLGGTLIPLPRAGARIDYATIPYLTAPTSDGGTNQAFIGLVLYCGNGGFSQRSPSWQEVPREALAQSMTGYGICATCTCRYTCDRTGPATARCYSSDGGVCQTYPTYSDGGAATTSILPLFSYEGACYTGPIIAGTLELHGCITGHCYANPDAGVCLSEPVWP